MDILSPVVSKSLLRIFLRLDPDFKLLRMCNSGSCYFQVSSLKIRVSDHFKKNVERDSSSDVDLIKPLFGRSYLVGVDGSVFFSQISLKILQKFLLSESFRKKRFKPERPQVVTKSELDKSELGKFVEEFDNVELRGFLMNLLQTSPQSVERFKKYCSIKDMHLILSKHKPLFGNIINFIYSIIGEKYYKGDCRRWEHVSCSFNELFQSIMHAKKNSPELLHKRSLSQLNS